MEDVRAPFEEALRDPAGFRGRVLQARRAWIDSASGKPEDFPMPAMRAYVAHLAESLRTEKASLGPAAGAATVAAFDRLLGDARRIHSEGIPYRPMIVLTMEYTSAIKLARLHRDEGRASAEAFAKSSLRGAPEKRRNWWYAEILNDKTFREGLRDFDDILLPVPFEVGFEEFNPLWLRRLFLIGVLAGQHEPEQFTGHDFAHWQSWRDGAKDDEPPQDVKERLEADFLAALRRADVAKLGLRRSEKRLFDKAAKMAWFNTTHEDDVPFGRQVELAMGFPGLDYNDLTGGDPAKMFGPRWERILRAGLDWYNDFWRKHRIPSAAYPG